MKKFATWALPAALTTLAVVWAVAAIGDTLTSVAHPAFAYSVAVLYDAVWLYALAQEAAHRRQGSSASLPKVIGWIFLPLTVAVLAAHGLMAGDVLAAIVGALVPVLAKVTLWMALDRDASRIGEKAQTQIDDLRAATRDQIAVGRALAAARADKTAAVAELTKRLREAEAESAEVTFKATRAHAEILAEYPAPEPDLATLELVSDADLDALLSGGVPQGKPALGTGGSGPSGTLCGTPAAHPSGTPPEEGGDRAVQMLAAELYASVPPPSKRQFRADMRSRMRELGLMCSNARLDALYDRERDLMGTDAESSPEGSEES